MAGDASNLKSINTENYPADISDEPDFSSIFAKIYPNPNDGNMTLKYSFAGGSKGNLYIYDIAGRKIATYSLESDKNMMPVTIENLAGGIYFYRVFAEGELVTEEKLVIFK